MTNPKQKDLYDHLPPVDPPRDAPRALALL